MIQIPLSPISKHIVASNRVAGSQISVVKVACLSIDAERDVLKSETGFGGGACIKKVRDGMKQY